MALVEYFNARRTSLIVEVNKVKRSENRELLMPLKTIDRLNLINEIRSAITSLLVEYDKIDFLISGNAVFHLKDSASIRTKSGLTPIFLVQFTADGKLFFMKDTEDESIIFEDELIFGVKTYIEIYELLANNLD